MPPLALSNHTKLLTAYTVNPFQPLSRLFNARPFKFKQRGWQLLGLFTRWFTTFRWRLFCTILVGIDRRRVGIDRFRVGLCRIKVGLCRFRASTLSYVNLATNAVHSVPVWYWPQGFDDSWPWKFRANWHASTSHFPTSPFLLSSTPSPTCTAQSLPWPLTAVLARTRSPFIVSRTWNPWAGFSFTGIMPIFGLFAMKLDRLVCFCVEVIRVISWLGIALSTGVGIDVRVWLEPFVRVVIVRWFIAEFILMGRCCVLTGFLLAFHLPFC